MPIDLSALDEGATNWDDAVRDNFTTLQDEKVNKAGDETISGIKTFTSGIVVPDDSIDQHKVAGLTTALTGKADTGHTHAAATDTAAGMVELATTAEAATGTDTTRAVTPAGLAAALSGLSGAVIVLTESEALPGGLADDTVVIRYAALIPGTPVVTPAGTNLGTTTSNTITVTTTVAIPAGDTIVCALARGISAGTGGSLAVTTAAGAIGTQTRASAQRSGVAEVDIVKAEVTTTIPSGTVVTLTTSGNSTNRAAAAVLGVHAVATGAVNATSGDDANGVAAASSAGANASATSLTVSTDASTTVADTILFGAWGGNASVDWSVGSGVTSVADIQTAAGSSDRFLLVGYKVLTAAGAASIQATAGTAGALCGAALALEIPMVSA